MDEYDIVLELTSPDVSDAERESGLADFASELGWEPADRLGALMVGDFANAHLVVEHGLQNTAVISFLRAPRAYSDLSRSERRRLLTISYNNLVDWHIQVERERVTFVFNRRKPEYEAESRGISRASVEGLRSETFEGIIDRRPKANLRALDDAVIETISFWKRNLSAEMGYEVSNDDLSALFNALILVRAAEDHRVLPRWVSEPRQQGDRQSGALLEALDATPAPTLRDIVLQVLELFIEGDLPDFLVDEPRLRAFDQLDRRTLMLLFRDFYRNKYAPYDYDFSLISKHALSHIYEHYVSMLRVNESDQAILPLFGPLPREDWDKAYGSVCTPQFVARFFARYLREQLPPSTFRGLSTADPACGSGIFLRTLVELQCDPRWDGLQPQHVQAAFENVLALDVDHNACQATRLSLALLHLALTQSLPSTLNIRSAEAIEYFTDHPELIGAYDAVIANPPFVSLDTQSIGMRDRVREFMGDHATGRIDMYLAFLRIGLEMLKPGGYGLFVLPHSFLLGENASGMRELIAESAWIRCLADLSAIRVFRDTASYVVLLVFQKRPERVSTAPLATVVKCQDLVGRALHDAVDGRRLETNFYSIYDVEQDVFHREDWLVLPPTESRLSSRLAQLPIIEDFLQVRQGFISGADEVFIVTEEEVPRGEEGIFVPYLPDREMRLYAVPLQTSHYFFYPYLHGSLLSQEQVEASYPHTWRYLLSHRRLLAARRPVQQGQLPWWRPVRPRPPERMMRPKIVTPHLMLLPRFSLDLDGRYAVSHSPLMYPRETGSEDELLRFFVAVLNSTACFWHIARHSHKYRSGYVMLEPKTLRRTPVPDPSQVAPELIRLLLNLVDERLSMTGREAVGVEKRLDDIAADLYGLSTAERTALGMEA